MSGVTHANKSVAQAPAEKFRPPRGDPHRTPTPPIPAMGPAASTHTNPLERRGVLRKWVVVWRLGSLSADRRLRWSRRLARDHHHLRGGDLYLEFDQFTTGLQLCIPHAVHHQPTRFCRWHWRLGAGLVLAGQPTHASACRK